MAKSNEASLKEFTADLAKFAAAIDVKFETVIRRIVLEIYDKITKRTPVDTGRARASWMMNSGSSAGSATAAEASTVDFKSLNKAQRDAIKADIKSDPFVKRWIYNNLPYIKALENGSSDQAPRGMVGLTVTEVEARIDAMIDAIDREKSGRSGDE